MKNRILSFLLATVMLITFALPVSAQEIINITDYGEGEGMEDGGEITAPAQPDTPLLDDGESPQAEQEDARPPTARPRPRSDSQARL